MLLGTLGAILLENPLIGKGEYAGDGVIQAVKRATRVGQIF